MAFDFIKFLKALNPAYPLNIKNLQDRKYYVDFASVRGGEVIDELKENITDFYPDDPTCDLFTGHIGCGKSTELLKLKDKLEREEFHVVYFESSEELEMADVDLADLLLVISRRIIQSLEESRVKLQGGGFRQFLQSIIEVLNSEVTGFKIKPPKVGEVELGEIGFSQTDEGLSLSFLIGEITTKTKADPSLRKQLNQYVAPRKMDLIRSINQNLLQVAITQLKQQQKRGLVILIDNLDRVGNSVKPWGRNQQEHLFIDEAEYLQKLHCHLVYTMPLALKFSDHYGMLKERYPDEPKVLPMVPVKKKDKSECTEGIALLRDMILKRAYPDLDDRQRIEKIGEVFENEETLDYLCKMSGGHVRDLLKLLSEWIKKDRKQGRLTHATLKEVIRKRRNEMMLTIDDDEWQLLRQVKQRQKVSGDMGYQKLIESRLVFEYRYGGECWFDINPILADAEELQINYER